MAVDLIVEDEFAAEVDANALQALALRALEAEGAGDASIEVLVTGDEAVRDLNARYRGLDEPTDVLSFRIENGEPFISTPEDERYLGEIVISFPTARRQAQELGHGEQSELSRLLVHGVLHLLGYDHQTPEDESAMRSREDALLA